MSATNVRRLPYTPPARNPGPVELVQPKRLVLTPIPWGKRDAELAKVVCRHVVDANLPIVIPFNPKSDAGLRRTLRSLRIHH